MTALRDADEDELRQWSEELGLTFPVLDDDEDLAWELYRDGGARPQYVVIDQDQMIVDRGEGRAGHESTQETVEALLAGG